MITAGEAYTIASELNRYKDELKVIEPIIIKAATEGKYRVTLYPSIEYHPKTIEELKNLGYRVCSACERKKYIIIWG